MARNYPVDMGLYQLRTGQLSAKVVEKGTAYQRDGAAVHTATLGNHVHYEVKGSEDEPYLVKLVLLRSVWMAGCTCRTRKLCSHGVAAAIDYAAMTGIEIPGTGLLRVVA